MKPFLDHLKPLQESAITCLHESFQAICQAHSVDSFGDESSGLPAVEDIGAKPEAVDNDLPVDPPPPEPLNLNLILNWAVLQRNNQNLAKVFQYLKYEKPREGSDLKRETAEIAQLIKEWDRLVIRDDVLMRRHLTDGNKRFELVSPAEFRLQALKGLHDDVGHPGRDHTIDLVRSRFYWPFMNE